MQRPLAFLAAGATALLLAALPVLALQLTPGSAKGIPQHPQAVHGFDVLKTAGGGPPQGVDFIERSYAIFPWLVLGVLVLTYLLLLRAFRSLLLPLKAVLLNLLSVGAAYGLLVIVFKWGLGDSLLGLNQFEQI